MDWNLFILFVVLNAFNVVIQTAKSIVTIKCTKTIAALVNALAYGLYTIVVVYTVCDLPLWLKVAVVAIANFIGVFVVKLCEERLRKEKLWKIEASVEKTKKMNHMIQAAKDLQIPFNYIDLDKYVLINFYCATQADSAKVKHWLDIYNAKYFVSETKNL